MAIYIVKNELDAEVVAYTNRQQADHLAEYLQSATHERYTVEELLIDA